MWNYPCIVFLCCCFFFSDKYCIAKKSSNKRSARQVDQDLRPLNTMSVPDTSIASLPFVFRAGAKVTRNESLA